MSDLEMGEKPSATNLLKLMSPDRASQLAEVKAEIEKRAQGRYEKSQS